MIGEACNSKDSKKIDGAPTCSANYQAINESGSTQSLTKTSLGSEHKDTPPNPPSLPNEVIANKTPSATSTTIDVDIEDYHSIQEFPTLPTGNNVWDSSPIPTVVGSSNGQHPSKHMSVSQSKPTPTKPWSQVLKQNVMEKSRSLQQHPSEANSVRLDKGKAIATLIGLEQ
ncbi:unnamed protein product [Ilex paraguariensis]|uniref:Uncharacterized protein n=1 Tax=Ilex paraguariensis TaxID=185542 RepID=A0ABC8SVG2_9AQUA